MKSYRARIKHSLHAHTCADMDLTGRPSSWLAIALLILLPGLALADAPATAQVAPAAQTTPSAQVAPTGEAAAPPPLPPAPATAAAPLTPVDDIVAVVNNDVITRHELDERYDRAVHQLEARKIALPPRAILEKQLLDRMVSDRIQLQFAAQTGIRVDAPTLDRAIDRIAEQNKMNLGQFRDALARDGVDFNKFRDDIRNEIILTKLHQREVDSKVTVSEAEVDAYLASQAAQGANNEYHLAVISVEIPDNADSAQISAAQHKADEALAKLRAGADFSQISTMYSNAPNALEGGDLGWRPAAQIPPDFLSILQALKPGEVSNVLRSNTGFHIFKLVDKRSTDQPTIIDETHARHILIKTNELVSDADAKKRLEQIRTKILDGSASFEDMAKKYSDDSSASKGGDLGWLSPGETVPEFEQAMNALKPGEISEPIKSPFGYHLIQVLERRQKDVTDQKRRLVARQAIQQRKSEEAQTEWLRELRDRAYVEYRPLNP